MERAYLAALLIVILGITAFGQKQKTQPDDPPQAKKGTTGKTTSQPAAADQAASEALLQAGTSLEAQIQSAVDVRKTQVGDQVILKTTKAIKQNGEVVVPKGSNLIGRITEVQRKTKENAVSRVGMVIERIQGKNLDVPVNASIVSMASAQLNAAAGDLFSTSASGSGGGTASSSSGSGGGLLGNVGSTVSSAVNTTTQTVGGVAGTATGTVTQATNTAGGTLSGLRITQSASGSANSSSTISAQGKDVRIEKGTTFQLRVDGTTGN